MCKKCVAKLRKITKKPFAFILHDNRCDVQKNKKCIKFPVFMQRMEGQPLPDKLLHDNISSLTVDKLKKCHNPCKYKGCGTFICIHEI